MLNLGTSALDELLRNTIGLDSQSIGSLAVARAVRERMKVLQLEDYKRYEQQLASDRGELQQLVENLVVPETWFLRHQESFGVLVKKVKEIWPPFPAGTKIKILSVPCSTGEEPYSIAISLLKAGFDPGAFEIEGLDISQTSLAACNQAVYGKNSFREGSFGQLEPYFEKSHGRFRLKEIVRSMVTFRWANVVSPDFTLAAGSYDFIFCRNLLIYLTAEAQQQLVQTLKKALRDEGTFFCGPAEATILTHSGFTSLKAPLSFAFQKKPIDTVKGEAFAVEIQKRVVFQIKKQSVFTEPNVTPEGRKQTLTLKQPPKAKPSESAIPKLLDQARALADRGEFATAAEVCHQILDNNQAEGEAHHILGLVHDAQGQMEMAMNCYKRVLYLNPNHEEALLHLALLKHKTGDVKGAQILQQRASRLSGLPTQGGTATKER